MGITFNPFTGFLDVSGAGGGGGFWADAVATEAALPATGTVDGETRVALDTDKIYVWDGTSSQWIDTGITLASFGSSPNANGLSLGTNASGNITYRTLTLQPADATNPGAVSTGTQTLAGIKTFSSKINADGGIDRSSAGTLTIGGTNTTTLNLGNSGATVNIIGTVVTEDVTNLNVTDKLITLNDGGGAGSGAASGIEIEENASITGYVKTSSDRNSWSLKAPNTAGEAVITPGAGGITLSQSSHDSVTLGAIGSSPNANGATLSTQVLNLEPASASFGGVVTTGTQSFAGAKTFGKAVIVAGNADEKQLQVRAHTTQNQNLQEWQDSAGTAKSLVNNLGSFGTNAAFYDTSLGFQLLGASYTTGGAALLAADFDLTWATTNNYTGTKDVGLLRSAAGTLQVSDGSSGLGTLVAGATTVTNSTHTSATASTVPYYDSNKLLVSSAVTPTQLSYVDATSSIQTQLNNRLVKSSGDIAETSFSLANNQSSAADVTGFAFANGTVRSFQALVSVYIDATSDLFESITIQGIQRGADWQITQTAVGDDSQVAFVITTSGQVQYTSANYSGFSSGTIKFRAITTTV